MPKREHAFLAAMVAMWMCFGMMVLHGDTNVGAGWAVCGLVNLVFLIVQVVVVTHAAWSELHELYVGLPDGERVAPPLAPWVVTALMLFPGGVGIGWFVGVLLWVQYANRLRGLLPSKPPPVSWLAPVVALCCVTLSPFVWFYAPEIGLALAMVGSAAWVEVIADMRTWTRRGPIPSGTDRWLAIFGWVDGRIRPELVAAYVMIASTVGIVSSAVQSAVLSTDCGYWTLANLAAPLIDDPMNAVYILVSRGLIFGGAALWLALRKRTDWIEVLAVIVVLTALYRMVFLFDVEDSDELIRRLLWLGWSSVITVGLWSLLWSLLGRVRGAGTLWVAVFTGVGSLLNVATNYASSLLDYALGVHYTDDFPSLMVGHYSYSVYAPWFMGTLVIAVLLTAVHRAANSPLTSRGLSDA